MNASVTDEIKRREKLLRYRRYRMKEQIKTAFIIFSLGFITGVIIDLFV